MVLLAFLAGSAEASQMDDLLNTSQQIVNQIDRGTALVGAAIYNSYQGNVVSPGLSASAHISQEQVQAYNQALSQMVNFQPYGDAQTFLENKAYDELDAMNEAVDVFSGAVVDLVTVVQVNEMAADAETPAQEEQVQEFVVQNEMTLQVSQETVDTYNQALDDIETHSNNAGAYFGVAANKEAVNFIEQGAENNNVNIDNASVYFDANQQWVSVNWGNGNATAVYINGQNFNLDLYVSEADVMFYGQQSDYYLTGPTANGYDCFINQQECYEY